MTAAIVAMCIAGAGCLLVYAWLVRDTNRATDELRTSQGRRIPPRSPSGGRRGF